MAQAAARQLVAITARLHHMKLSDLSDRRVVRARLAELIAAVAELKEFRDGLDRLLGSGFAAGEGSPARRETGRPAKGRSPSRKGGRAGGGERFALTDFVLGFLRTSPGSRPRDLVAKLEAETGKPHNSASAGVSTTLMRLRARKKVKKNRGEWSLA